MEIKGEIPTDPCHTDSEQRKIDDRVQLLQAPDITAGVPEDSVLDPNNCSCFIGDHPFTIRAEVGMFTDEVQRKIQFTGPLQMTLTLGQYATRTGRHSGAGW